MPAFDYDYDYYEYRNGKKVNSAVKNDRRSSKKVVPSIEAPIRKTRQSTKEQVRRATGVETIRTKKKKGQEIDILKGNSKKNKKIQKPIEMKLKKVEPSKTAKRKAREIKIRRVKNGICIFAGFLVAFLICYRYSLINEKFNILEKKKRDLETAETVNEQIQADIDSKTDLSYIENYAKYQLGMQKPSNSQIEYVNVEKKDRILTPVNIEEEKNKTWFQKVYEGILNFFN